ncbi:SBF-like CPA transporter family-domain-containing protein [Paraphysoderma sedebokerense]|nr:SBF-like CPA transporter family-domain-containing protein [Paraphysoderma sedebokerense]
MMTSTEILPPVAKRIAPPDTPGPTQILKRKLPSHNDLASLDSGEINIDNSNLDTVATIATAASTSPISNSYHRPHPHAHSQPEEQQSPVHHEFVRTQSWNVPSIFLQKIRSQWFIIGVIFVILLARLYPPLGLRSSFLRPDITVKLFGVSLIFFNSGVSLRTKELFDALMHYKIHLSIQLSSFILLPFIMNVIVTYLHTTSINPGLLSGLLVVSVLPPPVSSGVILTKAVGGNEAVAVFNSTLGSLLGIILTPWLLMMVVENGAAGEEVPLMSIFKSLVGTVVIPLCLGQLLRRHLESHSATTNHIASTSSSSSVHTLSQIPFGTINSLILLAIIYTVFCETFTHEIELDGTSLFSVAFVIVIFQLCCIGIITWLNTRRLMKFRKGEVAACMFCATHKSLTLGMPILANIFPPHILSTLSIPLLIYHPTQILLGSLLVPYVKKWVESGSTTGGKKLPI